MIELEVATRRSKAVEEAEIPFLILIAGDFGASAAPARPVQIDRDNFDDVLARLKVKLTLPVAGEMNFAALDDFEPDRLFASLDAFGALREARKRLEDPETFSALAAELQKPVKPAPQPAPKAPDAAAFLSGGSLLDEIVESQGPLATGVRRAEDPFTEYVRRLTAPYLVPRPDPKQAEMVAQVDTAVAGLMRAILHRPEFQALEAAWRALFFLIRAIETSVDLKVYILHLPKQKLAEELLNASDLRETSLYKTWIKDVSVPGAHRWTVLAGNYSFSAGDHDVELLGRIGLLAAKARAPFLASVTPDPQAWLKLPDSWRELKTIPEAGRLAMALPRFLLRLPYGSKTSPIESFPFEEMPESRHNEYLWGNPMFACVRLLAEAFSQDGWSMRPGALLDIDGLPVHAYKDDGEIVNKPCAEVLLHHETAEDLMGNGLMPLLSMKDSDRVHLAGFRGINGQTLEL